MSDSLQQSCNVHGDSHDSLRCPVCDRPIWESLDDICVRCGYDYTEEDQLEDSE